MATAHLRLDSLDTNRFAVIDADTGTVLNIDNLHLVPWPEDEDEAERILNNDSNAHDWAMAHGQPLFVEVQS